MIATETRASTSAYLTPYGSRAVTRPAGTKARPRALVNLACLYAEEAAGNLARAEQTIVAGFLEEAAGLGYHAEAEVWPPPAGDEDGIVRRWWARNVRGVFLLNVRAERELTLPWAEFSWVVAGNMAGAPALHRVGNEVHQLVKLALEQSLRLACRRPALAVSLAGGLRQGLRWAGAFHGNWLNLPPDAGEPPIYRDAWEETAFGRWLRTVKPDAVLALTDDVFPWVERATTDGSPKPRLIRLAANTSRLKVPGVCQDFTPWAPPPPRCSTASSAATSAASPPRQPRSPWRASGSPAQILRRELRANRTSPH